MLPDLVNLGVKQEKILNILINNNDNHKYNIENTIVNSIDINKMYIKRRIRNNSPIMDDSFAIMPVDHFLNIFNAYNNLDKMINQFYF
jgi:hypothetical protein